MRAIVPRNRVTLVSTTRMPFDHERLDVYAGSATESAAILDIGMRLALIEQKPHEHGKALLDRVVAMLVKLASALE